MSIVALDATSIELQVIQHYDAVQKHIAASLVIRNRGSSALGQQGWRLYFSMGLTLTSEETRARVQIIDGRYGYLEPTSEWPDLAENERLQLGIETWLFAGMKLGARQGFHLVQILPNDQEQLLGSPKILAPVIDALPRVANKWIRDTSPSCDVSPQTPRHVYEKNRLASTHASQFTAIPSVKETHQGNGQLDPAIGFNILADANLSPEYRHLSELLRGYDIASTKGIDIRLSLNENLEAESYHLLIDQQGIRITGGDTAGVFYGIQTLRQLTAEGALPYLSMADTPDWQHRGLFLDIARHFQEADEIITIIQTMAAYKMNRLHLGISNDEGWRLEIPSVPELTTIGSRREFHAVSDAGVVRALHPAWGDDHQLNEGFLSRQDMIRILTAAVDNHVEVVLEMNLPGHANAIIRSLENSSEFQVVDPDDRSVHRSAQGFRHNVVNICMDSTYVFVASVLSDINEIYRAAGVELRSIHLGGDETPAGAWLDSPIVHACQEVWDPDWVMSDEQDQKKARAALMEHYYRKITATVERIIPGVTIGFWHEMAPYAGSERNNNERYFNAWTTEQGQESVANNIIANNQYMVISNASFLYLDMPYGMHPDEPGLPWASYIDTQLIYHFDALGKMPQSLNKQNKIKGLQAQLWSETVYDAEAAEYYLFPRLLAVAERAWNSQPQPSHWSAFVNAIGKRELKHLETSGIRFRIPPPGAIYEQGILRANVLFPELIIRITTDGSEPQPESTIYSGPMTLALPDNGEIKLKAFTSNGRGSRTVSLST